MKHVKDLKITTKEGFSVKNLERFPSMEYGDDGGVRADVYYKGKKILQVYDAGNGGCAITYTEKCFNDNPMPYKEAALALLQRADKNWNKYDFLKNKTAKEIDDDDWLFVVNLIEERYDDFKKVDKAFKRGYKTVAILKSDCQTSYLQYRVAGITRDDVVKYLENNKLTQFTDINICNDALSFSTI